MVKKLSCVQRVGRTKSICNGHLLLGSQLCQAIGTLILMNILFSASIVLNVKQHEEIANAMGINHI